VCGGGDGAGVRVALQVYQLSIGAVCGLSWPADRLVVQVLDDSTDEMIKVITAIYRRRFTTTANHVQYYYY